MAHHRSAGGRRGLSRSLVFVLLLVVLVAACVVVWRQLGDRVDEQGNAAADQCVEGRTQVPVIADPSVAAPLTEIAANYGKTRPIVRDHCVVIAVRPADPKVTF